MRVMIQSPDGALAGYFSSAVRRIDKRGLLIDVPRMDGEDLELKSGQQITMHVQLHGQLFQFESRVKAVDLQVLLEEPGSAKRTERRSFYRLMLSIPARTTVLLDRELEEDEAPPEAEEVTVLDISGGGARVRTGSEVPVGTRLLLEFATDRRELKLEAAVVRTTANELGRGGMRYDAHLAFNDVQRADQDEVVRFVFQKQREFSQRGVA